MNIKALLPLTACLFLFIGCSNNFNQEFEHAFVVGCTTQGAPQAICQSVFTELSQKYSITDMALWNINGIPEQDIAQATETCLANKQ